MSTSLGSLLAIAVVAGSVVALVILGFFHEGGRQRLLPLLRPLLKRVINPQTLRAVARGESKYAVVHHVGRRSGRAYETPVEAYRTAPTRAGCWRFSAFRRANMWRGSRAHTHRLGDAVHPAEGAADGGAGADRAATGEARGMNRRRFE